MTFQFDKLTLKAQEAVAQAQSMAGEAGRPEIDSLHLLAALVAQREGVVQAVLDKIGVNRDQLASMIDSELSRLPKVSGGSAPQPNQGLRQALESAMSESAAMKDDYVSAEHLLLALAEHQGLVMSRDQLLDLVWGYDFPGGTRTVDAHISHLRARLEGSEVGIETHRGIGYKLVR